MTTIVQCDFDGTITEGDVSFLLLDAYADGNWRALLEEYLAGRITVGAFNTGAFAMVKADRQNMVDLVRRQAKVRAGFHELVNCCRRKGFQLTIVSNGLDFYIKTMLKDSGINDIEIHAAQTLFTPTNIKVKYTGPDGVELQDAFKEAYVRLFLSQGYRVIYVGNGFSDITPAKLAHWIFARGELLKHCRKANIKHTPFADLNDVAKGLELFD